LTNKSIDLIFTISGISSLNEVLKLAGLESTGGRVQLEGPQEVGSCLEIGTNREDLVDEILNAENVQVSQSSLDNFVVRDSNGLLVNLSVSALVDKLADGLQVGVTIGNVWLNKTKHGGCSMSKLNKDTIVDLAKTQQLQNLARLGAHLVDTLNANNEGEFRFSGNIVVTLGASGTLQADLLKLTTTVLTDVSLSALEGNLAGLLVLESLGLGVGKTSLCELLDGLSLLEDGLRDSIKLTI